MMVIQLFKKSF